MSNTANEIKYLKDYVAPKFDVESLELIFDLHETATQVTAKAVIRKRIAAAPLILNGENLSLQSIKLDGKELSQSQYTIANSALTISDVPDAFTLETVVKINPTANTALTGLYLSSGNFCTQCEAEGFRRITYYFDRPDVLTKFTTKIIADKTKYPILLSNGNCIERGELPDNKHFVVWQDPFKKPCYLFALVAGNLEYIEDKFTTCSGRDVTLQIYIEQGNKSKANYAMTALKQAMRWDEVTFNREYDLDIFMIVAVSDFNMGAMENKGLNIFNSKYILASEETATDEDYEAIAAVIAHEYCHNWSGDRVTCRDWFQLSLKEGLTVFRDQEFTSDTTSRAVKRIKDVRTLRTFQFSEDAGPMSHPVQPDSYMEIDNFYTHTVYEKGAEVIRMMKTIIGDAAFYKGMDLYFSTNDGKAVTIEEFVSAMEQVSGKDLKQFRLWYKQAGTPTVKIRLDFDKIDKTLKIITEQTIPNTAGQNHKQPMHIPLAIGLYDQNGQKIQTNESQLLELKQATDTFVFKAVAERPTLSILNDFSAPIEVAYEYKQEELCFLMQHDKNPFSRWEAGQTYIRNVFVDSDRHSSLPDDYLIALKACLLDKHSDPSFVAELLTLPTEKYLLNLKKPIEVLKEHARYHSFELQIAEKLYTELLSVYRENGHSAANTKEAIAGRKLKNFCLYYLSKTHSAEILELTYQQYKSATVMSDKIAAFKALIAFDNQYKERVIQDFYDHFKHDSLVLDKWFSAQAIVDDPDTINRIQQLMQHPQYSIKNPNKVRAVVGAFSTYNTRQFNQTSGKGYALLTDVVLTLNRLNPQIAARLLVPLIDWKIFAEPYRNLMQQQLLRIQSEANLSPDVFEVVEKSLIEEA